MAVEAEHANAEAPDRAWLLDMVCLLQTSLDLHEIIRLFSDKISELVPHSGVRFQPNGDDIELRLGRNAKFACQYDLVLADKPLGTLWFTRAAAFSDEEISTLETLISNLVHPLRNGLTHRDVLNAAARDPLTGLLNRASLTRTITREIQLAQRHATPLSAIIVDIDHFKAVNDTYGHLAGDDVLREVASRLRKRVRDSDMVFRFGGEEFVVILSNTGLDGAVLLADRLRARVAEEAVQPEDKSVVVNVTISAGVAELAEGERKDGFLARADSALYTAKDEGRNRVCAAAPPADAVQVVAASPGNSD